MNTIFWINTIYNQICLFLTICDWFLWFLFQMKFEKTAFNQKFNLFLRIFTYNLPKSVFVYSGLEKNLLKSPKIAEKRPKAHKIAQNRLKFWRSLGIILLKSPKIALNQTKPHKITAILGPGVGLPCKTVISLRNWTLWFIATCKCQPRKFCTVDEYRTVFNNVYAIVCKTWPYVSQV